MYGGYGTLTREIGYGEPIDLYEFLRDFGPHTLEQVGLILGDAIPQSWLDGLLEDGMAILRDGVIHLQQACAYCGDYGAEATLDGEGPYCLPCAKRLQ